MPTLINAKNCDETQKGTGILPCNITFGQPTTILRASPDWTFAPASETFNLDYVLSKVQDGTFTPFFNTIGFTNNTGDPVTEEYQGGAIAVVRNAKPNKMFEYNNGIYFHKAAYSYNGFQNSSVIEIDKVGNVRVYLNDAGTTVKGYLTNMFNTRTYQDAAGDATARTIIEYQIANEEAYNRNMAIITRDTIGADLNEELKGIIDVTLTDASATAAGGTITVTVMGTANIDYGIEGLPLGAFRVTNVTEDEVMTLTGIAYGANDWTYVLTTSTVFANLDLLRIEMYDAEAGEAVALIDGSNRLYRGYTTVSASA